MSGFAGYEQYDALGLAGLVRRKEVTPAELLEAASEQRSKSDAHGKRPVAIPKHLRVRSMR